MDIGIIGGSGLYALAEQQDMEERILETPFGEPSGPYRVGKVSGRDVAFLARHGEQHHLLPSEINYRANIHGFKQLGVSRIVSASAVGSLKEELAPRHFVLVDQFIDRTHHRKATFFGDGCVAHVAFGDPVCPELRALAVDAGREVDVALQDGGTYVNMEGPAFSTRAESELYRSWGADVIGMTNLTEAKLAREAELCYVTVAMVTDHDCWRQVDGEEDVNVAMLLGHLKANGEAANRLVQALLRRIPEEAGCSCGEALQTALFTAKENIPAATAERLRVILARRMG